jgi:predicted NAD/FAD-binding protein
MRRARIAVVGSGIAGLAASRALADEASVTLFEADADVGGHTRTVPVTLDGTTHGVDTGFLVYNQRTYPRLLELLAELGIAGAPADMSFSVRSPADGLEWSGHSLAGVFAQPSNALRPAFWSMLSDLLRFNRIASALAAHGREGSSHELLADFLDRHRFGRPFRDWYLLPMLGAIWSCPCRQMLRFPVDTLLRFCHQHGLLQLGGRPRWLSIPGGAGRYVRHIVQRLTDVRPATPVQWVRRTGSDHVIVRSRDQDERFDHVVLACHSDQSLALLVDATPDERALLGAIRFQANRAVLHTDASLLPRRRRAWAAWNYERTPDAQVVCVHYLLNRLQPLPWRRPLIVSLNPARAPASELLLGEHDFAHPVLDAHALEAQRHLPRIQGRGNTWFAGAWTGHGFHEDGLCAGLAVADGVRNQLRRQQYASRELIA